MTNQIRTQTESNFYDQDKPDAIDLAPFDHETGLGGRQLPNAEVFDFAEAQQRRIARIPDPERTRQILVGDTRETKSNPLGVVSTGFQGASEAVRGASESVRRLNRVQKAGATALGVTALYFLTNGFRTPVENTGMIVDYLSHLGNSK